MVEQTFGSMVNYLIDTKGSTSAIKQMAVEAAANERRIAIYIWVRYVAGKPKKTFWAREMYDAAESFINVCLIEPCQHRNQNPSLR